MGSALSGMRADVVELQANGGPVGAAVLGSVLMLPNLSVGLVAVFRAVGPNRPAPAVVEAE